MNRSIQSFGIYGNFPGEMHNTKAMLGLCIKFQSACVLMTHKSQISVLFLNI